MLLLGLAIWTVISSCGATVAVFLNGASIVKFQVIVASIFGIGCLTTKILFTRQYGIIGVPWAAIAAYVLLSGLPCMLYVPRLLKTMEEEHLEESLQCKNI